MSTARVLQRRRRRRTVPGRRPIRGARDRCRTASGRARFRRPRFPGPPARPPPGVRPADCSPHPPAVYRRRRVLAALAAAQRRRARRGRRRRPGLLGQLRGDRDPAGGVRRPPAEQGAGGPPRAGGGRPARRPGWRHGRPRCGGSRPAGRRRGARPSGGWSRSGRPSAGRRWAWTGRTTCRRPRRGRCPTAGPVGCAGAPTRPDGVRRTRPDGGAIRCVVGVPVSLVAGRPGVRGRAEGLWRRPVAHLVRIEGVRGSNPLSSTITASDLRWCYEPGSSAMRNLA